MSDLMRKIEIEAALCAAKRKHSAAKKRRVSANQRAILAAIANNTINTYDDSCEVTHPYHGFVAYSKVRDECRNLWSDGPLRLEWNPKVKTIKASFSRAVRSLIASDLLTGLALAWMIVGKGPLDGYEFWQWQGGSRRPDSDLDGGPPLKLKMLALTEDGWDFVAEARRQRKLERQSKMMSNEKQP